METTYKACAPAPASPRRPTNVTLPRTLLREARDLGIDLPQACENGLAAEVTAIRRQRWVERNRAAVDDYNAHVAEHDLPLATFRRF